jgi:RHS repeat-associated protein
MTRRSTLIYIAIAALCAALPAQAEHYLVVLSGHSPALTETDVTRLGGAVLSRLVDRIEVEVSPQAIAELESNPSVAYIQRVGPSHDHEASSTWVRSKHSAAPEFVPTPPAPWLSGEYHYDGAGNISAIGTTGTGGTPASDGSTNAYVYDENSRLKTWTLTGGTNARTETYVYDEYGNMTSIQVGNATPTPIVVDRTTNRLASPYSYDPSGNLTNPYTDQSPVTYDALNMATTSTISGITTKYIYTADDERIGILRDDTWTWSLRGADHQILRQYSSSESSNGTPWLWLEDYVYREGQLLAAVRDAALGGRRHFHLDHLGTPRLTTDDNGSQISQHDYTPWGSEITPLCQETNLSFGREEPKVFTGHDRDFRVSCSDTQVLDHMHARYYNPNVGRFLSVDSVGGTARNPQSWNRYSYGDANPMAHVDSSGRDVSIAPALRAAYFHAIWRSPTMAYHYYRNSHDHRMHQTISYEPQAEGGTRAHSKVYPGPRDKNGKFVHIEQDIYVPIGHRPDETMAKIVHEQAHGTELLDTNMTLKERFAAHEPGVRKNEAAGPNAYESTYAEEEEKQVIRELDAQRSRLQFLPGSPLNGLNMFAEFSTIYIDGVNASGFLADVR